jgi:GAF domain-containing protein
MANDAPARRSRRSRPAQTSRLARLLRQQASLRAVIESISGELELRPLLTRIVRSACELLEADHGTIGLVDDVANVVRTAAGYNMPPNELGAEMAPGVGLAGQVYLRRVPFVLRRYGDVPRPTQSGMVENTVVGMPIVWRGRMIGFFGIGRAGRAGRPGAGKRSGVRGTRPRPFSRADVNVLEAFARHAAIAIQNARQYEEELGRAERLAVVARVGRIVTANLELSEILQRAADAVHELLGYPNIAIPIVEPDDPKTLVLSTLGGHYRDLVRGEYRIPIERGIMGAAARAGETILVNDVANDPRYLATPGSKGIYSELAVPILLGGRVLGVLNVESDRPMTADDASNVRVVADLLAVAIENARL